MNTNIKDVEMLKFKETHNYLQFKELFISSGLEFNLDKTGEKPEGFIVAYECKNQNGELVGAAAICKREGYFVLQDIAVYDLERGKGIGEELLHKCMNKMEALGAEQIYITAKKPRFFERYGFEYVDENKIPDIFSCLNCKQYGNSCVPKFMTYSVERNKISIQETYGDRFQHCWGCGAKNKDGLHLHTYPSGDGSECVSQFLPDEKYSGGVPANLFGGLIATLFDCHGTASAAWFNHRNQGLKLERNTVITRYITARLEIDFKKPVPIGKVVTVKSVAEEMGERKIIVSMEMEADGETKAKARMVAVRIKDDM